jgi:hypothetical protein
MEQGEIWVIAKVGAVWQEDEKGETRSGERER